MRRALLLAAAWTLGACGPGPAPAPPGRCDRADAGASCVELGVGADADVAVDTIPIVNGPQGGWHLEVGLRIHGEIADGLAVEYEARAEDDHLLGIVRYAIEPRLLRDAEGIHLRTGDILILDVAHGDEVIGTPVTVTARIGAGTSGGDEIDRRTLVVVPR